MKVENVYSINELNRYSNVNKVAKTNEVSQIKDSIEISSEGKVLSTYAAEPLQDRSARIAEIKNQIANGTYSIDVNLTAQSIIKAMK